MKMAAVKKIKRAPAKRGRPAKKIAARRGRPSKPVKRLTRLEAAEIALQEALVEQASVVQMFKKISEKVAKLQARVDAHKEREKAKRELIPVFTKADLKAVA